MRIKNIAIATAIASLGFTSAVYAADGTINFTGNITDKACTVGIANSGSVALGSVAATAFKQAGDTAAATNFTITLSACPEATKNATVTFDGTASSNNKVIALTTTSGVATNVGVGIYEADSSTAITLREPAKQQALTADTANVLTYVAKYVALGSGVTAGPANATTTFTVTYQ